MRQTSLHDVHVALGAKMVDFGGWRMPVQYGPILDEVRAVRRAAGLFDLGHMGRFELSGPGAVPFADRLVTCHVGALPVGAIRYGLLCREDGSPIDDLLVYRDREGVALVVNAANAERDLAWLEQHAPADEVRIADRTRELAMVAVQGPRSEAILQRVVPDLDLATIGYYQFGFGTVCGMPGVRVSRTGYTGDVGFEIYFPDEEAVRVWNTLLEVGADDGLRPVGLGARDTLRLEAGMALYGHEIDAEHGPVEAGLGFALSFAEAKGDWIGRAALAAARGERRRKLVGITTAGKRVPRQGYALYVGEREVGHVCSGAVSPTLDTNIGTAYLPLELARAGQTVDMDIRGKRQPCTVADLPFYSRTRK